MVKFALVHVITVIYHTIPFIDIHTDSCQLVPLSNNLLVMKNSHYQQFMSNLCYIIYINLFIRAFGSQTTFNDPCLIQFILYLTKMMGE